VAAAGLMQGFARAESKQGEGSRGLATETMISSRWAGSCDSLFGPQPNVLLSR
jgi:hypothetical protein